MTAMVEMNDEDDEFLDLFEDDIQYIAGGSESGFYLVEKAAFEIRLYCVEDAAAPRIYPVPLKPTSLHAKQCLILGMISQRSEYFHLHFRYGKDYLLLAWNDGQKCGKIKMSSHCGQNQQIRAQGPLRSNSGLSGLRRERVLAIARRHAR